MGITPFGTFLCHHCSTTGGGVLWLIFAGYLPLASQGPYPIIVYSVASHRSPQAPSLDPPLLYVSPTVQTFWYVCYP